MSKLLALDLDALEAEYVTSKSTGNEVATWDFSDKLKQGLTKTRQAIASDAGQRVFRSPNIDGTIFMTSWKRRLIMADLGASLAAEGRGAAAADWCRSAASRNRSRTHEAACGEILCEIAGRGRLRRCSIPTRPTVVLVDRRQRRGQDHHHRQAGARASAPGAARCCSARRTPSARRRPISWRSGPSAPRCDIVQQEEGADPAAVVYRRHRSGPKARGTRRHSSCDTAGPPAQQAAT